MTDATPTPEPVAPQPVTPAAATPPQYTTPTQPAYPAAVPGKTLGIVALVFSILGVFSFGGAAVIGVILGFVGRAQSKAVGFANTPAKVAIIVGFIVIALGIIAIIAIVAIGAAALAAACSGVEPGTYVLENGGTLTCG